MSAGPDLPRVVAAFRAQAARYVVIGGFAVMAHQYVRATEDVDLLIPDDADNDERVARALGELGAALRDGSRPTAGLLTAREHVHVQSDAGPIDLVRPGLEPLDFATVDSQSIDATVDGVPIRVCGLESLVAFKRLAGRPQDLVDLDELETRHGGTLPRVDVPGVDDA